MDRRNKTRRRRHSVVPSAVCCLTVATALLLFSRAGGESAARALLTALGESSGFVAHAVGLELGLSAGTDAVFAPRTPSAARQEDVPESTYLPAIPEDDTPVLSAAEPSESVALINETDYSVDVAACLADPLALGVQTNDEPQVLIVHTHGSESYQPDAAFPYTPTETDRTTDTRYNVVRVGDELRQTLEAQGITTLHCREMFDTPAYSGSYDRALREIERTLAEHPTIKVVIDVHRDSILTDDGQAYKTAYERSGETFAQLMLVVGTDAGGLSHDNWRQNLNVAVGLQSDLNQSYPGLMRPVYMRTQRFNQHARVGSMLVEVGSSGNTLTEALASVRLFGGVLAERLTGA